jgi:flagellar biosynthesis GTPase FlhF
MSPSLYAHKASTNSLPPKTKKTAANAKDVVRIQTGPKKRKVGAGSDPAQGTVEDRRAKAKAAREAKRLQQKRDREAEAAAEAEERRRKEDAAQAKREEANARRREARAKRKAEQDALVARLQPEKAPAEPVQPAPARKKVKVQDGPSRPPPPEAPAHATETPYEKDAVYPDDDDEEEDDDDDSGSFFSEEDGGDPDGGPDDRSQARAADQDDPPPEWYNHFVGSMVKERSEHTGLRQNKRQLQEATQAEVDRRWPATKDRVKDIHQKTMSNLFLEVFGRPL